MSVAKLGSAALHVGNQRREQRTFSQRIESGKPTRHAFIKSFHGKFQDEMPGLELIGDLRHSRR
jgi:hypothetical protein